LDDQLRSKVQALEEIVADLPPQVREALLPTFAITLQSVQDVMDVMALLNEETTLRVWGAMYAVLNTVVPSPFGNRSATWTTGWYVERIDDVVNRPLWLVSATTAEVDSAPSSVPSARPTSNRRVERGSGENQKGILRRVFRRVGGQG
jgi:hypothetical protein